VQLLKRTEAGVRAAEQIVQARNVRFGSLLYRIAPDQREQVVKAMKILAEVLHDEPMAAHQQVVA
jgi:DNA-binding MarR family transcriptional regulator